MLKKMKSFVLIMMLLPTIAVAQSENVLNTIWCSEVGGKTEVRHYYQYGKSSKGYIKVDCETVDYVYEAGLDKRSSLDSIQQALFAATLTGKKPGVVVFDTDGKLGKYEHRIQSAANYVGLRFVWVR